MPAQTFILGIPGNVRQNAQRRDAHAAARDVHTPGAFNSALYS